VVDDARERIKLYRQFARGTDYRIAMVKDRTDFTLAHLSLM
jgi:hypothetical protein